MRPSESGWKLASKGFVFLAPPDAPIAAFDRTIEDPTGYSRLLGDAQRLRGRVYVEDGAIERQDLTGDGRHIQEADSRSWHLLEVDEYQRVTACLRYFPHSPGTSFQELSISHTGLAQSSAFRSEVRDAVEAELEFAAQRGLDYFEIGGWAISEEFRGTCDALRMVLCVYALAQLGGGALGLSTATTRHHSSSILKRIGARPLMGCGEAIRPYYDPQYGCEMELLSFDSSPGCFWQAARILCSGSNVPRTPRDKSWH